MAQVTAGLPTRRGVRRLRNWFAALACLIVLLIVAGFLLLRTSLPQEAGAVRLAGIAAPVEVVRDANGVPAIFARSEDDAYFALGFVHAQDRLWQMEAMRRLGAGRLSEFAGARTLAIDRWMRVLGIYRLAEATLPLLSPEVRRAIDSYAAGVNGYLRSHSGVLPPEFLLTGDRPEPWRPADSLVWGKLMAMMLSGNWEHEALLARLAARLTPEEIDQLFPPEDGAPPTMSAAAPVVPREAAAALQDLFADYPLPQTSASNAWVVSGQFTEGGKPLLTGDPHLRFQTPNLWYLARIETPQWKIIGATAPGVPFTILGHNGAVAWSFTTTESDTRDLYIEKIDPSDPKRYLTPDGALAFESRQERIKVRGAADEAIEVRATRHGPVLSDARDEYAKLAGSGHVIAGAAVALMDGDLTPQAIYRLNRARDAAEVRAALVEFTAPQQNILYADAAGDIGFIAAARVPIRSRGEGLAPAPGWTGEYEWTGFIPFDALPQSLNPPSGRIVNANHRIVPDSYRYFLGHGWTPAYRAQRIHQILDAQPRHTPESFALAQIDKVSLAARDLLPLMLPHAGTDGIAGAARELLSVWDGAMARERPEPLIFTAWLRALNRRLYEHRLGPDFPAVWDLKPTFVKNVLMTQQRWCDDPATQPAEDCPTAIRGALDDALAELVNAHGAGIASWRWGEVHYARFRHALFDAIPVVREFGNLRVAQDGSDFTLNRGTSRIASALPYASVHGAGYRAVYDLGNLDNSRFMQATGQSGNPLSRRYGDLKERWRDGGTILIAGTRDALVKGGASLLTLLPEGAP